MKNFSLFQTMQEELLSVSSTLFIIFFGFLYVLFSASLLNYRLAINTLVGNYPLVYKWNIFFNLVFGTWTTMSRLDFFLLLITSLLVGINILLMIKTLYILQHASKKVRLSIGGATVISLVTTGCTSCGLSVISLLGLSASLSFLPFHGLELHIGALVLLIISAMYMLKQLWNTKYCKIV